MVTVRKIALVYSQKRGAPREIAVETEGSAPQGLLRCAHHVQGAVGELAARAWHQS